MKAKRLPVVDWGNPILHKKAEPVPEEDILGPEIQQLVKDMFHTMRVRKGVGLAAPQIGEGLRLFVVNVKPNPRYPQIKEGFRTAVVNPEIHSYSEEKDEFWEGCLSLPGVRGLVPRSTKISVYFKNERGEPQHMVLEGFNARVFQHEFDHLEGVVFTERMSDLSKIMTTREYMTRIIGSAPKTPTKKTKSRRSKMAARSKY